MRRKTLLCWLFLCVGVLAAAQNSVFVLVDVSGSVPEGGSSIQNDAKQIAIDFCLGRFNSNQYADWEWIGPKDPLIEGVISGSNTQPWLDPAKDGYLMIMPFGEKNTYQRYRIERIQQVPIGVNDFFAKYYPTAFRDRVTYIKVAEASAASVAKGMGIASYFTILITDELSDSGSQSPGYTRHEEELIAAWGTSAAQNKKLATLKNKTKRDFQITFHKVEISGISIIPGPPGPDNFDKKELNLIRPAGTQSSPEVAADGSVSVMWNCLGCDTTTEFSVKLSPVGAIEGATAQSRKTRGRTTRFVAGGNGLYRLVVSAEGFGSKTGFVRVSGISNGGTKNNGTDEGGGGFWVLLLLALLAGGAYWFFRNRQEKGFRPSSDGHSPEKSERDNDRWGTNRGGDGSGKDSSSGFW